MVNRKNRGDDVAEYALDAARAQIQRLLQPAFAAEPIIIQAAKPGVSADLSVPVFDLAKKLGRSPVELAREVADQLDLHGTLFAVVAPAGNGYLNFTYDASAF